MRRFVSAASSRGRLKGVFVACYDCHIDAFASQFAGNGFADASAAAGHDGMLAVQSEVHGALSPVGGVTAILLVRGHCSLGGGVAQGSGDVRQPMQGDCGPSNR